MKSLPLIFLFFFFFSITALAQQNLVSGVLYFTNGTKLEFSNVGLYGTEYSSSGSARNTSAGVLVEFENSKRRIPFSKLKEIVYSEGSTYSATAFQLKTITGVSVNYTEIGIVWYLFIYDKLTGENKGQNFPVIQNYKTNKLLIKKIVFNN